MHPSRTSLTPDERLAIERLIGHARRDSGQCRRVADFLLSWWNAQSCGGFDLTEAWVLDDEIREDLVKAFGAIARVNAYPDAMGYKADFEDLVARWRPHLVG